MLMLQAEPAIQQASSSMTAPPRGISERGRADAVAMGAQIRANGLSFTRIVSSPWCRCVETAKLMDLGPVDIEPAFSNAFVLRSAGGAEARRDGDLEHMDRRVADGHDARSKHPGALGCEPNLRGDRCCRPTHFTTACHRLDPRAELIADRLSHRC
jgi:hypothetical protein